MPGLRIRGSVRWHWRLFRVTQGEGGTNRTRVGGDFYTIADAREHAERHGTGHYDTQRVTVRGHGVAREEQFDAPKRFYISRGEALSAEDLARPSGRDLADPFARFDDPEDTDAELARAGMTSL